MMDCIQNQNVHITCDTNIRNGGDAILKFRQYMANQFQCLNLRLNQILMDPPSWVQ